MPSIINCPQCAMQLRVPDTLGPGTSVKCPQCGVTFAVPGPSAPLPPVAPSQFPAAPPPMGGGAGMGGAQAFTPADQLPPPFDPERREGAPAGDYRLDLNAIFNWANPNYTAVLGQMIGFMFVLILMLIPVGVLSAPLVLLIPIVGNLLNGVVSAAVQFPLMAGFIYVAMAQLRNQAWTFGDFFIGFRYWVSLFVTGLIIHTTYFLCLLPSQLCMYAAGGDPAAMMRQVLDAVRSGQRVPPQLVMPNQNLMELGSALQWLGMAVMVVVGVRFFVLAPYIILDRNCGPMEAIRGSMEIVRGHFWGWVGVSLLFGLIGYAPVFLCCIPILFSLPYGQLLFAGAYLEAIREREQWRRPSY